MRCARNGKWRPLGYTETMTEMSVDRPVILAPRPQRAGGGTPTVPYLGALEAPERCVKPLDLVKSCPGSLLVTTYKAVHRVTSCGGQVEAAVIGEMRALCAKIN